MALILVQIFPSSKLVIRNSPLGCVWFYRKIESGKENEWIDLLSMVWHYRKEGEKRIFLLGSTSKTFSHWIGRKGKKSSSFS